jgi:hypothetical protein
MNGDTRRVARLVAGPCPASSEPPPCNAATILRADNPAMAAPKSAAFRMIRNSNSSSFLRAAGQKLAGLGLMLLIARATRVAIVLWTVVLAAHLNFAFAQLPPMEVVTSQCSAMQSVVDSLVADHADPARLARRDSQVSPQILDQLIKSDIEQVEKLFRCFSFDERTELGERVMWTSIPVAILNIPMTSEKKKFGRVRVNAWILITKRPNGTVSARGEYRAEY